MAVTFTVTKRKVFSIGDRKMVVGSIACTGTPTAGGDALAASDLGLEVELDAVNLGNAYVAGQTTGLVTQWDHTDNKVAFYTANGTPAASTALTAFTGATANYIMEFTAVGKGSATA